MQRVRFFEVWVRDKLDDRVRRIEYTPNCFIDYLQMIKNRGT